MGLEGDGRGVGTPGCIGSHPRRGPRKRRGGEGKNLYDGGLRVRDEDGGPESGRDD